MAALGGRSFSQVVQVFRRSRACSFSHIFRSHISLSEPVPDMPELQKIADARTDSQRILERVRQDDILAVLRDVHRRGAVSQAGFRQDSGSGVQEAEAGDCDVRDLRRSSRKGSPRGQRVGRTLLRHSFYSVDINGWNRGSAGFDAGRGSGVFRVGAEDIPVVARLSGDKSSGGVQRGGVALQRGARAQAAGRPLHAVSRPCVDGRGGRSGVAGSRRCGCFPDCRGIRHGGRGVSRKAQRP